MKSKSVTGLFAKLGILTLFLWGCGSDPDPAPTPQLNFEAMGLTGHKVSQFAAYDNDERLYAATDKGLYAKQDDQWQRISPLDWDVNAVEVLYPSHILASITLAGEHKLMESLNTGSDWNEVNTDFGGVPGTELAEPILNLLFEESTGMLYGVGYAVLAESGDFGRSWTRLDGDWQMLASGLSALTRDPYSDDIWTGGQGAIENPVLHQVSADGVVTDHSAEVAELLEAPSVIKSIQFVSAEDEILASGEGGIIKSSDGGTTWMPLHVNTTSRFYFDVIPDPEVSDRLYTAGWNKNFDDPQPLRLEISHDGGVNWEEFVHDDTNLPGGVWSMTLRQQDGQTHLYLGLCNGGIYRVNINF